MARHDPRRPAPRNSPSGRTAKQQREQARTRGPRGTRPRRASTPPRRERAAAPARTGRWGRAARTGEAGPPFSAPAVGAGVLLGMLAAFLGMQATRTGVAADERPTVIAIVTFFALGAAAMFAGAFVQRRLLREALLGAGGGVAVLWGLANFPGGIPLLLGAVLAGIAVVRPPAGRPDNLRPLINAAMGSAALVMALMLVVMRFVTA